MPFGKREKSFDTRKDKFKDAKNKVSLGTERKSLVKKAAVTSLIKSPVKSNVQIDKGNGDNATNEFIKDDLNKFIKRDDVFKSSVKTNALSEKITEEKNGSQDNSIFLKKSNPKVVIKIVNDKEAKKTRFQNASKIKKVAIVSKKLTNNTVKIGGFAYKTGSVVSEPFKKATNDSPTSGESLEKVLRFSADRNIKKADEYKSIKKVAKKELKALDTGNRAKEVFHYKSKEVYGKAKVKSSADNNTIKRTKSEVFTFSSDDTDAKITFKFSEKEKNKGAAGSGMDKQESVAKGNLNIKGFKLDDIKDRQEMAKSIKKAAKQKVSSEKRKAAAKRSIANVIQTKNTVIKDIGNTEVTGDLYKDGVSPLLQAFLNKVKNAVKDTVKRLLKTIAIKLAVALLPLLPVFIVIILVINLIPHMRYGPQELKIPTGDGITIQGRSLTAEEYFEYYFAAQYELTPTTSSFGIPLHKEAETVDEDNRKKILSVIHYALLQVGSEYCQVHRLGNIAESGTVCRYESVIKVHGGLKSYDCSGLVWWLYKKTGLNLAFRGDNTAAGEAQYLTVEEKGLRGHDLLPGDVVFYGTKKNGRYLGIYHVALYIGGGKVVEAYNHEEGVIITDIVKNDKLIFIARPYYKEKEEDD